MSYSSYSLSLLSKFFKEKKVSVQYQIFVTNILYCIFSKIGIDIRYQYQCWCIPTNE